MTTFRKLPASNPVIAPMTINTQSQPLVNGLDVGVTPIVLKRVPAQPTAVVVSADGFDQVEQKFSGDQASAWTAQLTLQPLARRA